MKQIPPAKNINEALEILDNGGRFYNFKAKANDGRIDQSELGKVAGIFSDHQEMILFLEMLMIDLTTEEKNKIVGMLDQRMQEKYDYLKPQYLNLAEVNKDAQFSNSIITKGIPKLIESKSEFTGFIMIPIVAGNVTSFSMIPLIEEYEVYEIKDSVTSKTLLIAHTKSFDNLPTDTEITVAGVLKELIPNKNDKTNSGKFLEIVYYV
ncbi:hypothetical protein [Plebeiibacterium sediminum]|uniref:Uncharacterized protein n=1 Tax=Plebeiibacterium sediminum TaxID=2992112 RepID=A0AAE3SEB6_9BACT|nr:hypothetical protein [Plebeiobacterium sediminum]MCW3785852.1 hypothetical protein [Plebeiobacterium sediminum]